jgi:hypothetical protein
MAKKVIDCLYTFTPGTRTVTITNRYIRQESLLLITNITKGVVIYNFSDPDLKATSYVGNAANSAVNVSGIGGVTNPQSSQTTTIVLNYNTTSMSSTDKIQIIIDEQNETFVPGEVFTDPVQKLRVSTPQAMIDTDFEYSVQPSKWEFINLVNNWPSFFSKGTGGNSYIISAISGNGVGPRSTITVTTSLAHGLTTGDIVAVQETSNQLADGTYTVTVTGANSFTYVAKGVVSGSILDSGYTVAYGGGVFDNATIAISSFSGNGAAQSLITLTTVNPHGLMPGAPIVINNASSTQVNGNWIIVNVSAPNQFQFFCASVLSGAGTVGSARLTTSPEGYVYHRSTDGGVSITPGGNYVNTSAIRQTRRYFRYQSGKALQFSTGWKGTPTYDIDTISGSGTTATVTTMQDHNLQAGATVLVEGLTVLTGTNFYNGTFTVASVTGTKSFTYTMLGTPTDTAPVGDNSVTGAFVTATRWTSGVSRVGLFDDQNGFFFEYDGNQIFACRRQSIKEMFGRVTVTQNSEVVTGLSTRFRRQFVVGDYMVIRGQNYLIQQIDSDTQLRICPTYRGPSIASPGARYLRTQTYKIPQSQWNMDPVNGTGPSGYNLDISKMQMAYIDYTWYGAGHIRFGFRGVNGDIIYCHRMPNNNVNTAAYMRSGNLPGRFEVANVGYFSKLTAGATGVRGGALSSTDTTLYIENAQFWPTSGFVMVKDATNCEMIQYTGVGAYNATAGGYPLTGLTRRTSFTQAGVNIAGSFSSTAYTYSGTASSVTFTPDAGSGGAGTSQVSVTFVQNTCAAVNSHWGVSAIMDGRYDEDKSFIFTAGQLRYLTCQAGVERPLLMIRVAPSVDSGNGRNFGVREIINRMQLTLVNMGVYAQGQFLIQGKLNPATITGTGLSIPTSWDTTPGSVGSGSLSQVYYFDSTGTYSGTASTATGAVIGGDRIFGFYTENSGGTNYSATTVDLTRVRDLGTSILSGNGTAANPSYPNGPDILVITATLLEATGTKNLACRIGWTEAQA